MIRLDLCGIASLVLGLFTLSAGADDFKERCEGFAASDIANAAVLGPIHYESAQSDGRPERCIVKGRIVSSPSSTINFRVDLPSPGTWNTKVLMLGGGGFDGMVPTDVDGIPAGVRERLNIAPKQFYSHVVSSTDSGHQGRGAVRAFDFSWSAQNPSALLNHAYEANHLVLGAVVSLAKSFYGKSPTHRYMVGSSNGGRQGIIAAQMYPDDYDGILSFVPAISQQAYAANQTPFFQHVYSKPENWLNAQQLDLYVAAEKAACDELDGLKDGVIGNPHGCHYDPAQLVCKDGTDGNECLTPGQADAIRLYLSDRNVGVSEANGMKYPRYLPGSTPEEWKQFVFGSSFAARNGIDFILADMIVKNTITNDPTASIMTHDPQAYVEQYTKMEALIDATNPDLSAFSRSGGKLIILHSTGDYCVAPERTAQYVSAVRSRLGESKTREFVRFFAAPGLGHGMSGPGADRFPVFTALQEWVERGRAPTGLVATKNDQSAPDGVKFTRPLCEYGSYPKYKGSGDPTKASSFVCTAY